MLSRKLRVGLVGCGQIADAHLQEINKIPFATAAAVCDQIPDLAKQAAARFRVPSVYSDFSQMLAAAELDVIHITTPPKTHRPLAKQALAAGVHVYVEKPFTLDAQEADEILQAAEASGCRVCVGHDQLFDPVWEECRSLHAAGQLGDVIHIDSIQGYDLGGPFGKVLASEPDHWVHRLPGGLFQNVMSHAMYRITEFMPDEDPLIWATWFGARPGATGTPTELRVMLRGRNTTANLLFSSTMRPVQRLARIYGTRQAVEVDLDGRTIRAYGQLRLPGPFAKLEAPFRHMREAGRTLCRAAWKFARSDIHYFAGMNQLFRRFYQGILEGTEGPIPPGEIRRVTALMDKIFCACDSSHDVSASARQSHIVAALGTAG